MVVSLGISSGHDACWAQLKYGTDFTSYSLSGFLLLGNIIFFLLRNAAFVFEHWKD
jgi:hypothetical protein